MRLVYVDDYSVIFGLVEHVLEAQVALFLLLIYKVDVEHDDAPSREARVAPFVDELRELVDGRGFAAAGGAGQRDVVLLLGGERDGYAVERAEILKYLLHAARAAAELASVLRAERRKFVRSVSHSVSPSSSSDSSVSLSAFAAPSVIQSFVSAPRSLRSFSRERTRSAGRSSSEA